MAREGIIAVRCKHAGVDVIIAVAREGGPGTVAPERIVIDVIKGERPEQRPDPSIAAVAVSPPSGAAVVPARQRRASADPGTHAGLMLRGAVTPASGECARAQRLVRVASASA